MTSVVMFSRINEPLLTKLKEQYQTIDIDWLIVQNKSVNLMQRNIVRADKSADPGVHLVVFPREYHNHDAVNDDPRYAAWQREISVKPY